MMSIPSPRHHTANELDDSVSSSSQSLQEDTDKFESGVGIEVPGEHDLLLGRGGETNTHSGNVMFRKLINKFKPIYIAAPRKEKPEIARQLVAQWRAEGGRFLAKRASAGAGETNTKKKLWYEIGDEAAKKRASKSLGEKQNKGSSSSSASQESSSQAPALKLADKKLNAKTKLRSLEARASRRERQGSTSPSSPSRCLKDRSDILPFLLAQQGDNPQAKACLYQALSIPQRQEEVQPLSVDHNSTLNDSSLHSFHSHEDDMNFGNPLPLFQMLSPRDESPKQANRSPMTTSVPAALALLPDFGAAASPHPHTHNHLITISQELPARQTSRSSLQASVQELMHRHDHNGAQPQPPQDPLMGGDLAHIRHVVPTAAELTECWEDDDHPLLGGRGFQ